MSVRYPGADRDAVDAVSFEVPAASFTVLLGPSGCGKSTLLRTVNRLILPRQGRVFVGDEDVRAAEETALRRRIGYAIQAVGLFSHMTVAQNIAVVPTLLRWEPARIAARVDQLLELVRLDPARYRGRFPSELSGGEGQRVGVARAIAAQPAVLLMDEPFGAVDAIVRASLQDEMLSIAAHLHTTVLFVTHDVDEALKLADRIVVMRAGRVAQAGTPLGLLREPANEYVAELLGAHDVARRLALLFVHDAMGAPREDADASIEAGATLRDALSALLDGARVLAVHAKGQTAGSLTLEDVQRALRSA